MTSSYTTRKRLNKQGTGDNTNSWGATLNAGALDVLDFALDGWTTLVVSADHTLSTANGSTAGNEAGARCLKLTTAAAPYIQTLPAVEGWYIVWNACTAAQTIASSGGGATVSIGVGEIVFVACDATNVKRLTLSTNTTALDMGSHKITSVTDPTSAQDAATKAYVDATAFSMAAGSFPAQGGNTGKFTQTDGSAVSWQYAVTAGAGLASVTTNTLTVTAATAAQVRAGTSTAVATTPGALADSAAYFTLTDASTVAWNTASGYNAALTLTANSHAIGAPSGILDGLTYTLMINPSTFTLTSGAGGWDTIWDFGAVGYPTLTASKWTKITAQYNSARAKLEAAVSWIQA